MTQAGLLLLAPSATLIQARALGVGYFGRTVMPPVDWCIGRGEVWALVGDNGSGKTTLLRSLLKLLPACEGTLDYAPGLVIAYMAQRQGLDAAMPLRVRDFVAGGAERGWSFLRPRGVRGRRSSVESIAAQLGFADLLDRQLVALSEGQKQRASLGRALISKPDVLVLDEPTSAMDMAAEAELFASLRALAKAHGMAIIVVGHHLPALLAATSHWAWAQGASGGLVQGARPTLMLHPGFQARYAPMLPIAQTPEQD